MPYEHLTREDREVIYRMKAFGENQSAAARALGKHRSTISRERKRNTSSGCEYDAGAADTLALVRRQEKICSRKTGMRKLMSYVEERLRRRWSPEQIAGRLRMVDHPGDETMSISTGHIYRWLWREAERWEKYRPYLRHASRDRRKPYGRPWMRGRIVGRVSIEDRPAAVDGRREAGHWEGDTMEGVRHRGYVLSLVERTSRLTKLRGLRDKQAGSVTEAWKGLMKRVPVELRRTGTVDNGKEFAGHAEITASVGMAIYFARPYHAWERGTNENTNGLVRQYFPKGTDFREVTYKELAHVERALNNRPRKCLGYRTPREVFADSCCT